MNKYKIGYYYHASGMELGPDEEDYGVVEANNREEAIKIVCDREFPKDVMYGPNNQYSMKYFFKSCLHAEQLP